MVDVDNSISTADYASQTTEVPVDPVVVALRIVYYIFTEYVWFFVVVLGMLGNIMSIIITLQKDNRRISTCNYMTALALADSTVTMAHAWGMGLLFWAPDTPTEFEMQAMWYQGYAFGVLSGFYLAEMTIDRLIVVRFPMSAPRLCTSHRACVTIVLTFIVVCGLNLYIFWTFRIVHDESGASILDMRVDDHPELVQLGTSTQLAVGTLLPFVIIVSCNVWIIIVLRNAAKERGKMGVRGDGAKSREKETQSLTKMLILVSIAYVVTSIPYRMYDVISGIKEVRAGYDMRVEYWNLRYYIQHFVLIQFWEFNYGINFYLYCIGGGKKYRSDVKQRLGQIFSCCQRSTK